MNSRDVCVRCAQTIQLGDTVVPVHEVVLEYATPGPEGAPSRWAHAVCPG